MSVDRKISEYELSEAERWLDEFPEIDSVQWTVATWELEQSRVLATIRELIARERNR